MKRCKHNKKVELTEWATASTSHWYEAGKVFHDNDFGDYTGAVTVECRECGFRKDYSVYRLPAWVKKLYDYVLDSENTIPHSTPGLPIPKKD